MQTFNEPIQTLFFTPLDVGQGYAGCRFESGRRRRGEG